MSPKRTLVKDFSWNLPNALSVARIICGPLALVAVAVRAETAFVAIFIFAQITDILDGYLARRLNLQSEAGALLDSYADVGSYLMGAAGLWRFHLPFLRQHGLLLLVFLLLYVANLTVAKLRWGRFVAGTHLYSSKITGYLQGIFLVMLFAYGYVAPVFYIAIVWGILSECEAILINLLSAEPLLNAKGLYWAAKEGRLR